MLTTHQQPATVQADRLKASAIPPHAMTIQARIPAQVVCTDCDEQHVFCVQPLHLWPSWHGIRMLMDMNMAHTQPPSDCCMGHNQTKHSQDSLDDMFQADLVPQALTL
jgi:hypothetical protein